MSEKSRKPAKIASAKADELVALSQRACGHCGDRIPTNKVLAIRTISLAGTRMIHYHRDHYAAA